MTSISLEELKGKVGAEIGTSKWFTLDQARIDAFANATEDHQFIHVDPDKASQTWFGGTIAHGFLSLSMLSAMAYDALPQVDGLKMMVNYGFDKVRFLAPVPAGTRIRGALTLAAVEERAPGQYMLRHQATVEIEGKDKPALTADWLGLIFI